MPAVKGDGMRGLAVFISDIRNCKSKEAEIKRINKELANIRSKFKGDKTLDGYQKKKYVCKLLFIFLLGHDIDFGHMEAVNLLSCNKYTEKQIGYLFISVLLGVNSDLMKLVIKSLRNDVTSNNPIHVNLALHCIANIGSREMAEAFGRDIPKLLVSGDTLNEVKQSSALCLLRLFRTAPELVPMTEWASRIIHLLNDQHMGVVTSACSLIDTLSRSTPEDYKGCVPLAVSRLSRIVTSSYTDLQDYSYYFVPAPWLCVKLLRLLQNYPPSEDPTVKNRLVESLENILNRAQEAPKVKKVQHPNAKNAVLFEAINLIIHMDCEPDLLVRACNQLGQFLQHRETNLRYLALESMCLLATSEFSHDAVKKHQETIINSLKNERDVSVRQRAVDLLYAMCDRSNAEEIVSEMLTYLETADYSIREEMVLKVAILSEKYAIDYTWYVDVILNLIRMTGDYVSEEVWYRVIQIVINRDDVQGYAAKTVFEALQAPACHENMVKVGGYILGEFGNLIAGDSRSSPLIQFQLLHSKFHLCSLPTRQLLLSTYVKFINLFPEVKQTIQEVLQHNNQLKNSDVELQQRATEYLKLSSVTTTDVMAAVLEEMPPFPERDSSILAKLKKKKPKSSTVEAQEQKGKPEKIARPVPQIKNEGAGQLFLQTSSAAPSSAQSDLLNLATPPVTAQPAGNAGMLADILGLGDLGGESSTDASVIPGEDTDSFQTEGESFDDSLSNNGISNGAGVSPPNVGGLVPEETYKKFICKHNGVLFESDLLQIGVKSEYRQNLGRITLFYGNKTSSSLAGFNTDLQIPSDLSPQCSVTCMPVEHVIDPGEQKQQLFNVECITAFTEVPRLNIQFMYSGSQQRLSLNLPVLVNKFIESVEMDSQTFFQRWKLLSGPEQECQKIFQAKQNTDREFVKGKLLGFGSSVLENVDPNPSNYVMAGIIHTRSAQVGCLLRLEYNADAKMYRLTIRSSTNSVAVRLCELLQTQL